MEEATVARVVEVTLEVEATKVEVEVIAVEEATVEDRAEVTNRVEVEATNRVVDIVADTKPIHPW